MTTKTQVDCSGGSHFQTAVEAGRQAFQADAWQDGRCACFAFGWSEAQRKEEAQAVSSSCATQEPKGESDFVCGWCQQVVSWSARFVDQFDGNTPYHKVCWEHRQAGVNIARAMNRPTTLDDLERARQATAQTADHLVLVDGEWVRQVVDAPENFIEVPAPLAELAEGWCGTRVGS